MQSIEFHKCFCDRQMALTEWCKTNTSHPGCHTTVQLDPVLGYTVQCCTFTIQWVLETHMLILMFALQCQCTHCYSGQICTSSFVFALIMCVWLCVCCQCVFVLCVYMGKAGKMISCAENTVCVVHLRWKYFNHKNTKLHGMSCCITCWDVENTVLSFLLS